MITGRDGQTLLVDGVPTNPFTIFEFDYGSAHYGVNLGYLNENELEQFNVYLEAFEIFQQREAKYHSLWKQYGASDSYHHITSKAARTQFYLEGIEDDSDPIDLINYTVFLIRNVRAGRFTNTVERRWDAVAIALEDIKAGDAVEIDLETGKMRRAR